VANSDAHIAPLDSEANGRGTLSFFEVIDELRKRAAQSNRYVIAVAGPPGAGKSKFSEDLRQQLEPEGAVVVPMDGFHYDNSVLDQRGLRARKGAPETFDYRGFELLLRRIRERETDIAFPVFDREADLARAGAALVDRKTKVVIVEGNYLLLDEEPWSRLAAYFDFTIFIDVSKSELHERLLERWRTHGYSQEGAETRVATNDRPNVDRVLSAQKSPDLFLIHSTGGEQYFAGVRAWISN
jgi:pantothenate kinase